jgi:hypothetical protein
VAKIDAGIDAAHKQFLRHPGGIGIRYRLEFQPVPNEKANFVFRKGLDGLVTVRWPELRARVEGPFFSRSAAAAAAAGAEEKADENVKTRVREGSFNFDTFTGVMHDGDSIGQITTYRDPFSSASAYPLRFQYFAEFDQLYTPDGEYKSVYWLPHALRSGGYAVTGSESVEGVPCQVVRKPGLDTIWVATGHGHVICKREHNYGVGKPIRERTLNSDLKEVAPGIWIPTRLVREAFADRADGALEARYTVRVTEVKVGNVTDEDVRAVLPDTVRRIDDMVTRKVYFPSADVAGQLDTAVQKARESNLSIGSPGTRSRTTTFFLVALATALGGLAVYQYRSWRGGAKPSPDAPPGPTN